MNENIDLTKILKDCPEGTTFWSDNYGEVQFKCIIKSYNYHINYPILVKRTDGHNLYYTKEGWHDMYFPASCLLWRSKDCRNWSKFTAPWYNMEKFDPKTLKAFDRVLVRNERDNMWRCSIFSHINDFTRPQRKYKIFSFEIKKLCLDEVFLCFFICIFNS